MLACVAFTQTDFCMTLRESYRWHMQGAKPEVATVRQDASQPAVGESRPLPTPSETRNGRAVGLTPAQVGPDFQTAFEHIALHGRDAMQMLLGAVHGSVLTSCEQPWICISFVPSRPSTRPMHASCILCAVI